jgi:hypothetical protein
MLDLFGASTNMFQSSSIYTVKAKGIRGIDVIPIKDQYSTVHYNSANRYFKYVFI